MSGNRQPERAMGQALFDSVRDKLDSTPDPGLLGWFVSMFGKWTVMLLIDGEVISVSGFATRHGRADLPPEST